MFFRACREGPRFCDCRRWRETQSPFNRWQPLMPLMVMILLPWVCSMLECLPTTSPGSPPYWGERYRCSHSPLETRPGYWPFCVRKSDNAIALIFSITLTIWQTVIVHWQRHKSSWAWYRPNSGMGTQIKHAMFSLLAKSWFNSKKIYGHVRQQFFLYILNMKSET